MQLTQNLYETTVIINAALEDPQIEAVITRLQELLTANSCETVAVNRWGRKRLMYIINKKNNGYYVNIEFKGPGSIVKTLEHAYLLDEQVIRFLTIRVDKKALKARAMAPPPPVDELIAVEVPPLAAIEEVTAAEVPPLVPSADRPPLFPADSAAQ
jgi:small subunit ribosomal protein S6